MDHYIKHGLNPEHTINVQQLVAKRVLARSGYVYGRVQQVRLGNQKLEFEGILIRRGLLPRHTYISKDYIEKVTGEAVILGIDPADMFLRRPVVSVDGKKYGIVNQIIRRHHTNDIEHVIVTRRFKKYKIPHDDFAKLGASLILKKTYEEAKTLTPERK